MYDEQEENKNEVFYEQDMSYGGNAEAYETAWGYSTRTSHIGASPHPRQSRTRGSPSPRIHVTPTHVSNINNGNMMDNIRAYMRDMLPSIKHDLEQKFAEESKIASRLQSKFLLAC